MSLLINFVVVLTILTSTSAEEPFHLTGIYKFLPYEKLTDEKLNGKRLEISNATEFKIERFSIPTSEILNQHLNNTLIETLTLRDITFENMPENGMKIYLPRIKKYRIFVRDVELEDSERKFEMLRRYLLVEKQNWNYYKFTVDLGSKTHVQNWIYGVHDWCWLKQFPPLPANEVKCKYFEIQKQSIDLTSLPVSVEWIRLFDADIYETVDGKRKQLSNFHDMSNHFPKLKSLTIYHFTPPNYPAIFDLSYLQPSLEYFEMIYGTIIDSGNYENERKLDIPYFHCEHCEFEINNYTNAIINSSKITLRHNNYPNPDMFQHFISSLRNVKYLFLDDNYNFNINWLNETSQSLEEIILTNIIYQQPKISSVFPKVSKLTLVYITVIQLDKSLDQAFPNLEELTMDTNLDLLSIFSANNLSRIAICFPETGFKNVNSSLQAHDYNFITYERATTDNSWIINEESSSPGIRRAVRLYTHFYILAIFVISSIGLIGNLLIIIVYGRQQPRTSTSYIIISLALYDSLLLMLTQVSLAYFQIKLTMDQEPLEFKRWEEKAEGSLKKLVVNPRGFKTLWFNLELTATYLNRLFFLQSKLIYPLSKAAYFGSVYTTVLLTLERYSAICFPFRVKDFFNLKYVRIYFSIFGILSISLGVVKGIESFYSNELFDYINFDSCGTIYHWERSTSEKNPLNYRLYRLFFQGIFLNVMMYFIPIPLLLALNYRIWKEIRQSSAFRARSSTTREQDTLQITSMLVCVSLVFVVCNSISGIIVWYHVQRGADHLADVEIYSCLPLVANSSVNFIIYSVLGKKFREEFGKLFGKIWNLGESGCCQMLVGALQQRTIGNSSISTENHELSLQRC